MRRRSRLAGLAAVLALAAPACTFGSEEPRVVLGVGSTTEQRVLAALTVAALERADVVAEVRTDLGGTVGLRREAIGGAIDVFWDYTGAAWALGMGQQAPPSDPEESYQRVLRADEENGLTWLEPSTANATLALFVREEDLPPERRPRGLGWLAGVLSAGEERLCADPEFITRSGGLEALAAAYAIDIERLTSVTIPAAEPEAIAGASSGRCFAALATATSGEARLAGLVPVADDLMIFPAFIVAPVARSDRLPVLTEVAPALQHVTAVLTSQRLAQLNAAAERGGDPGEIAEEFLDGLSDP